ncbi:universal stress protein [Actinokineospora bangkokensis]|uniref:UspA domain-containing protein n=1 Tax=Actinokineospora bangkokensis TaxID=1193682 RepID=A0A1Q9LR14_9PSEU|nr:universal stress protein [Actinokineospora bangkokensis]OLR94460.1 hypothetical protein BJP25_11955 [Actinokineospora bangkokensis]
MPTHHPGVIVVGADGSPTSDAAVHWAFDEAAARGLHVQVITVHHDGHPVDLALSEHLDRIGTAHPGVPRWYRQAHGQVGEELVRSAEGAALLVVGSRGPGRVRPSALGSVAAHCLRHAPCPVVVVPATSLGHRADPTGAAALATGVRR